MGIRGAMEMERSSRERVAGEADVIVEYFAEAGKTGDLPNRLANAFFLGSERRECRWEPQRRP
jgi:hypothetical protein